MLTQKLCLSANITDSKFFKAWNKALLVCYNKTYLYTQGLLNIRRFNTFTLFTAFLNLLFYHRGNLCFTVCIGIILIYLYHMLFYICKKLVEVTFMHSMDIIIYLLFTIYSFAPYMKNSTVTFISHMK